MKHLLFLLIFVQAAASGQTGDKNFIDQNYIEVFGRSELEITPDLSYIRILLNEKDDKSKVTLATRENQMVSKLKEVGIDVDKDLLIKDMASNFKYYWLSKSDILLSKEYQVIVKDGKTASRVFVELENWNFQCFNC